MAEATILIVDDNPTNLAVLSEALAPTDWEVLVAVDGQSSIEQAQYAQPDLILLDVMMPNLDGFETCHRLKENESTQHIPVIFMTALNDAHEKVKGLSIGAVDYITKPFQKEEVIARVKLHLRIAGLSQQLAAQNVSLEQQVQERTQQLNDTIAELKQSQLQLIQHEKLSSLGQLVAGVAHEINNPITFVNGNLGHLNDCIKGLVEHLRLYQDIQGDIPTVIAQHAQEIDLPYVLEDLPRIIDSMHLGTQRIVNISHSLRTFARADTQVKALFNVREGIESTLLILRHRIKADEYRPEIEIVCDWGEVSDILCFPGQLNQVFMNLFANAFDAFDEFSQDKPFEFFEEHPHRITIQARQLSDPDQLEIHIADNGPGMPPDVQSQIFDYLFTTKAVGKGTGLGLSICRQIVVEKHQGSLSVNSELGKGTEFLLQLPYLTE